MPRFDNNEGDGIDYNYDLPMSPAERERLLCTTPSASGRWEALSEGMKFNDWTVIGQNSVHYLLAKQQNGNWVTTIHLCSHLEVQWDEEWMDAIAKESRTKSTIWRKIKFTGVALAGLMGTGALIQSGTEKPKAFQGITEENCRILGITVDENGLQYNNNYASGSMHGPISIKKINNWIHATNSDGQVLMFDLYGDPIWYISGKGAKPISLRR